MLNLPSTPSEWFLLLKFVDRTVYAFDHEVKGTDYETLHYVILPACC